MVLLKFVLTILADQHVLMKLNLVIAALPLWLSG